jgi:ferredoxin, 2Fe-2S
VAIVTVRPLGARIDVGPGESLMAAAVRSGYWWPTVCGGLGQCRACFVTVVDGIDNLSTMVPAEVEAQGLFGGRHLIRLACQLRVLGPVTVVKHGVRDSRRPDANKEMR